MQAKWVIAGLIVAFYLLTWIRGPAEHDRDLRERAQSLWAEADAINHDQQGGDLYRLIPDGPRTKVSWCIPILPGLMLANSEYHIARLYAAGGYKVVLFYGFGAVELGTVIGWIS